MNCKFCRACSDKGPMPDCAVCEKLNGRAMTKEEGDQLMAALQKAWEDAHPDYWLDAPFPDGTTPRGRGHELP